MTAWIGRIALDDPRQITWTDSGVVLDFGGMQCGSYDAAVVLKDQLTGLARAVDEPYVVLEWDQDAGYANGRSLTGLYKVGRVSVSTVSTSMDVAVLDATVELQRVASGEAQVEAVVSGGLRSNSLGVSSSTAQFMFGVPVSPVTTDPSGLQGGTYYDWTTATGGAPSTTCRTNSVAASALASGQRYTGLRVPSTRSAWYVGAAQIAWQLFAMPFTGQPLILGRGMPDGVGSNWEISNGLVKLAAVSSSSTLSFVISGRTTSSGTTWIAGQTLKLQVGGADVSGTKLTSLTINGPDAVSVDVGFGSRSGGVLSLTLRRGVPFVEARVRLSSATSVAFAFVGATGSATTGGVALSGDSAGNQYVIASPSSASIGSSSVTVSGSASVPFCLGAARSGTMTAAQLVTGYLGAGAASWRVIG